MKKVRKAIKGCVFLTLFLLLFQFFQGILLPKWYGDIRVPGLYGASTRWNEFYDLDKNSVDVMFVGTSHTYCGIDPMYLYGTSGITAFNLAGSDLRLDATYAAMRTMFRYQKPSVIMMDMSAIHYKKSGSEARAHMVVDQLPLRPEKVEYALGNQNKGMTPLEVLFPLLRYHSRWSELGKQDADYYAGKAAKGVARGYSVNYEPHAAALQYTSDAKFKITKHNLNYLDKITALCKEQGVELILMKIPAPRWTQAESAFCQKYAEDNHLTYLEFYDLLDEIGFDLNTDFRDNHDHMNQYGAEKVTGYLQQYLTEHYDLTDYRGKNSKWDQDYQSYLEIKQLRYEASINGAINMEGVEEG